MMDFKTISRYSYNEESIHFHLDILAPANTKSSHSKVEGSTPVREVTQVICKVYNQVHRHLKRSHNGQRML